MLRRVLSKKYDLKVTLGPVLVYNDPSPSTVPCTQMTSHGGEIHFKLAVLSAALDETRGGWGWLDQLH